MLTFARAWVQIPPTDINRDKNDINSTTLTVEQLQLFNNIFTPETELAKLRNNFYKEILKYKIGA